MNKAEYNALMMSSIKSLDTEEKVDLAIFRPLGLRIALLAKRLGITPNVITIVSVFAGVAAGHLFYYDDILINILGILCLSLGSTLDSADGQLARMTGQCSEFGRILDGVAGYLWFVSIYLNLILRFYPEFGLPMVAGIVLGVLSHSYQSGVADYYRNAHLTIVVGKGELADTEELKKNSADEKSAFSRFVSKIYIAYTEIQQGRTKNFRALWHFLRSNPEIASYSETKAKFRRFSLPLQKYCNGMTLNSRFFAIYFAMILNNIWVYIAYEVIVLNIVVAYTIHMHERGSKKLLDELQA